MPSLKRHTHGIMNRPFYQVGFARGVKVIAFEQLIAILSSVIPVFLMIAVGVVFARTVEVKTVAAANTLPQKMIALLIGVLAQRAAPRAFLTASVNSMGMKNSPGNR